MARVVQSRHHWLNMQQTAARAQLILVEKVA